MNMNALTLGDLEYYERKTGEPITSFDPEAGGKLARPMIAMCAVLLFRRGATRPVTTPIPPPPI